MTDNQEKTLWKNYKENKCMKSRDRLFIFYMHLSAKCANTIFKTLKMYEFDDLLQMAYLGLIDALDKFDISKNLKFKTYAYTRINGAIYDETRKLNIVKRQTQTKIKKYKEIINNGTYNYKEQREIANKLSIDFTEWQMMHLSENGSAFESLDYNINSSTGDCSYNYYADVLIYEDNNNANTIVKNETCKIVNESLNILTERDKTIIKEYFYNNISSVVIADKMKIKKDVVIQAKKRAIHKLYRYFVANNYQDLLLE